MFGERSLATNSRKGILANSAGCWAAGRGALMNIVSNIGSWGGWLTGYVVPFLFVLTIVVFFHELGHFLVARWCRVRVLTFSVGFGPELFGFNDKHGTRWKVSAIPLGGYIKFFGDENAASVPDQEKLEQMSEAERRESRRRPDRQLHPRHRHLCNARDGVWKTGRGPAHRRGDARHGRGRGGLQAGRSGRVGRRKAGRGLQRRAAHHRHQPAPPAGFRHRPRR